ncbi:glycerophosphoryldiester phosphodiesterase [Encephalitozoon intestinalis ATCC 50506]|uniref:Glycerophosphoryldiester phosphodiesterase n=1 Tax=Encephalitozoon intestinalis (strain ATCC 50506) TaxID=876142 RepID=E0S5K9_ENCIT|nr:glycerophosphoryldiester phosphodiesterase [Encephalitozoon intestinalis ATCC 50506]ADM10994.1 glycerophosphoryldiester phosphodiesterase [Encephalitozoon intestinalis ATCC 50506]UTX44632.1 glycerophosphoryldiester phosphodiesterase [Encephalitozoon intestinalis]
MEHIDWSNPEFFFKDGITRDFTTVEEEFQKIRSCKFEKSQSILVPKILLVIKNSKEYKGMHVKAVVEESISGKTAMAEIYPESFLMVKCEEDISNNESFSVQVEVWSSEGMISEKSFRIFNREVFSKVSGSLSITFEGRKEEIEMEIYSIKPSHNASEAYEDMKMIGHRGCGMNGIPSTTMMENTISSIQEAYRMGAKWVEIDVQLTKEGIPIVFHDFVIEAGGLCLGINEITLQEFLRLVGNPNEERQDLPCTLSRLLECVSDKNGINIEIKYPLPSEKRKYNLKDLDPAEKVVEKIVETIQKSGKEKIVFSSFHPYILLMLKLVLPNFGVYMITETKDKEENPYTKTLYGALYFCTKLGLDGIVLDWNCIAENPADIIKIFKEFDLKTIVYGDSINNRNMIRILNELGVYGIIVDDLKLIFSADNNDHY